MATTAEPLAAGDGPPHENGTAPNGAAARSPAFVALAMRPLPPRGDTIARKYWWFGIVAYLAISGALVSALVLQGGTFRANAVFTLFGLGDHPNLAVALLVALGIAVTAVAVGRVLGDIQLMMAEEEDIEWVRRTKQAGLGLVFLEPADRERAFEAQRTTGIAFAADGRGRVETLLDERVRRVHISLASADGGVVVPAELRGIAEVRTAAYGAFARYASSLLLLLAVLGTFAGVKTALPELIRAIGSSTTDNTGLVNALNAVASAFGGNALALVGAVAVGLMAQGVSLGRRNLLERLELVSAEYLYGGNVAAEANPMQGALVALRETARELRASSGAMLGIESGLQGLGTEFRDSMEELADRLRDIVAQQEKGLYDRTADAMLELKGRMQELANSVEANAQTYAGLSEAVGTRSRETTDALQQMRQTNAQLADALRGIVGTGQQTAEAFGQLQSAVLEITRGSAQADARLDALTAAVRQMDPTFAALGQTLAAADERLRASEGDARRGWERVGEQVAQRLGEAAAGFRAFDERAAAALEQVRQTTAVRGTGAGAADPEVPRLLRELVTTLRPPARQSPWMGFLIPFAAVVGGVFAGGGALYALLRATHLVS